MKRILYLAANPKNTTQLRLDEEVREIEEGLRRSEQRSQFEIESAWAVRVRDIRRAILDYNPNIIHFSGHGEGDEGLVFEDESGNSQFVDGEALAELVSLFSDSIECVILNACYSDVQAQKIGQCINYVIGMDKAIGDRAAVPLNINQSPFNVGFPIELAEFNVAQVEYLIKRHGLKPTKELIESLMNLCGGHPFITRLALYEITDKQIALPDFLKIAPTEQSCCSEHLHRHLGNLNNNSTLLSAFKRVIESQDPVQAESTDAFKLRSMGLVKYQGNKVIPPCDLYRRYFCDRLGIN